MQFNGASVHQMRLRFRPCSINANITHNYCKNAIPRKICVICSIFQLGNRLTHFHVGGEFFNQMYFDAWCKFASDNTYRIFYAYTKSLPYWINRIDALPDNFSLTASYGGRADWMIEKYNLKYALVVNHPDAAKKLGLEIDHDDSHAVANDNLSFALLLHGVQKAGSEASNALKRMNKEQIQYRYGRGK